MSRDFQIQRSKPFQQQCSNLIQYPTQSLRTPISPGTPIESRFYNSDSVTELCQEVIELKEQGEDLKWRHAYFFFRGLRHIQMNYSQHKRPRQDNGPLELTQDQQNSDKTHLAQALQIMTSAIRDHGVVKSYQILKVLELSQICKFDYPEFWKCIQEQLSLNAEFETIKDVIDVLQTVRENPKFGDQFWQRMTEKIVSMSHLITCKDFIEIMKLFSSERREDMCKQICQVSKKNIVEEIDNLTARDILGLLELYKDEPDFKKFIGFKLKDKIVNAVNIQLRELMTSIVETLELEELRGEIVKYALNSEMFYAFPLSYHMSLLIKMYNVGYSDDLYDLLKTIQIQLCLKKHEITDQTMRRIMILHQQLPVLNPHFLQMLIQAHNRFKGNSQRYRNFDIQIFNLNISQINLSQQSSQSLQSDYETAFSYELYSESIQDFNLSFLIEFLQQNLQFAEHGFYKGFSELLFAALLSDPRANSDIWLLSVLNKLMSFDIKDRDFIMRVDKLIEQNLERYVNTAIQKVAILILQINPDNQRYKETLIRKLRGLNPEHLLDQRQGTLFLLCVAQIDKDKKDQFQRYLIATYKLFGNQFNFSDIHRIVRSFHIQKETDNPLFQEHFEKLLERVGQLSKETPIVELLNGVEIITQNLDFYPNSMVTEKHQVFNELFKVIDEEFQRISQKFSYTFTKYQKSLRVICQNLNRYQNSPFYRALPQSEKETFKEGQQIMLKCQQMVRQIIYRQKGAEMDAEEDENYNREDSHNYRANQGYGDQSQTEPYRKHQRQGNKNT